MEILFKIWKRSFWWPKLRWYRLINPPFLMTRMWHRRAISCTTFFQVCECTSIQWKCVKSKTIQFMLMLAARLVRLSMINWHTWYLPVSFRMIWRRWIIVRIPIKDTKNEGICAAYTKPKMSLHLLVFFNLGRSLAMRWRQPPLITQQFLHILLMMTLRTPLWEFFAHPSVMWTLCQRQASQCDKE